MNRPSLFLAAIALVVLSGCALLTDLLTSVFQKPGFSFKSVALREASLAGVTLDTT